MTIKGKPAVRLHDVTVKIKINVGAYLIYWQGWEGWIPKSICHLDDDNSLTVQEWFYDKNIKEKTI